MSGPPGESDADGPRESDTCAAGEDGTTSGTRSGLPEEGSTDRGGGDWDLGTGWALAAYVFGVVFLVLLGSLFLPQPPATVAEVSASTLVLQGVLTLPAALIPAWVLLILAHGTAPGALGFHLRPSAVGETIRGTGIGVAVIGVSVAVMAAAGVVRWVPDEGSVAGLLAEGGTALGILVLPAAAEEAFFRGYPLQLLSRSWGPGWALIVTSIGFGLLHGSSPGLTWVALLNLVVAGMFLGVVFLKTGSLWWATGAHLGWNWALGFLVDLPVSGLEIMDTPLWTGVASGPAWLGGGSFGPEGSLLTTVIVLAATLLVWRTPWLSPGPGAGGEAGGEGAVFAVLISGRTGAGSRKEDRGDRSSLGERGPA